MNNNTNRPSLASTFPLIAREWSKLNKKTPDQVAPHSNQYAYWECEKGHVWEAKINNRVNGSACPFCAGKKPIPGETDLKALFPEVASLWHPFLNEHPPEDYLPYSNEKVFWLCPVCGMEWCTAIYHLVEGTSCPYCSGRRPIPGKTDFKTVYPDVAALWDYKRNGVDKPEQYTPKAHHSAFWLCSKGHSWAAPINRMAKAYESARPGTALGTLGCPVCSGKKVIPGVNDLVTTAPELAAQWDYEKNGDLLPSQVTLHRNRPVFWRCEKGHVWPASPNNRARGTGCPFCNSNRLIPEETSLLIKFPLLANEWDEEKNFPLTAKDVPAFSNDKYWWRCPKGHRWKATVSNRANGRGCPVCVGRIPVPGVNTLDITFPDIAEEWHPDKNEKKASEVLPHSDQSVWWRCKKGHEWSARISDRVNGSKCPYCTGRFPIPGVASLKTMYPRLATEIHPTKNDYKVCDYPPDSKAREKETDFIKRRRPTENAGWAPSSPNRKKRTIL